MKSIRSNRTTISNFYNGRGVKAQNEGPLTIPIVFEAPYEHAYSYLSQELKPGSKILDFACGTGIHTKKLASMGFNVLGIDISEQSIKAATSELDEELIHNCKFILGDENLPTLKDLEFDAIFVSGAMYYLDLKFMSDWFYEHLSTEGCLVIIETLGNNPLLRAYRRIHNSFRQYRDDQSLEDLLYISDYDLLTMRFSNSEFVSFDFLTLPGIILNGWPRALRLYLSIATRIDRALLSALPQLAFKIVFTARKISK